ncbi:hypothetical protein SLUN_16490 [Streptomyces lunaelactis]|uniref:Response regulatory domain-containing protein n=1 Tax=Streptomyces lunaelactis TaxID=1535768 RepID=A0A2R4T315_9ACTN|nr:response regulator [Streptomyces lunaelactis]AVZ73543.1 hypothetical protein SLUN_16490 [Streptomyces lunaelactis]NUK84202.1 response regulator [Streptomyces lunaelactis]NUL06488.1 response regulator [Streptomyces lunaelactis]
MTMDAPHVLVVEDEQDVSNLLSQHLRGLGCRVDVAATGEGGMERAFADPPDLAIVDILLPGIDGREVIRRLRADDRTSGCRIAVFSVLDPQDLTDLAADAMLAKPFRRAAVAQLVDSFARRPEED